ncbi:MAG: vWA domain-containing protein [Streptosporangiaceae bacterium]
MAAPVSHGPARELHFTIEIDATGDLAIDTSRVDALITVTARPTGPAAPESRIAEVLIMDRSLSMDGEKILQARHAACAAIDALPDGTFLGIIAGNDKVESLFPSAGGLASINAKTRETAKRRVLSLWPEGGTKIGRWLLAARQLFTTEPATGAIRHAVLYTDGRNEHETSAALDDALNACADRFLCDVRGLGDDWDYSELLRIAETLHGDAAAILSAADLTDDFTQLMHKARRLVVPRTYLRLRPNDRFRIASITQTHPALVDLTQRQQPTDGAAADVPLGSWQAQTRRYQLTLHFTPDTLPTGEELRAARVELLAETPDGKRERYADAALVVCRHAVPGFQTRMPESLTQVEKERELIVVMQACADAGLHGRRDEANDELDRAIRLAREVADPVRLRLLEGIAIIGPDRGAQLRPDITPGELQRLGLHSTKTNTSISGAGANAEDEVDRESAEARRCRACGETTYAWHPKHCEACGEPFDRGAEPFDDGAVS